VLVGKSYRTIRTTAPFDPRPRIWEKNRQKEEGMVRANLPNCGKHETHRECQRHIGE